MPSLHKRPESPFWVASYQDGLGRWLKKSTKTSDRSLALKIALEWENAARAGRAGRLVESQCRRVLSEIHEQATGEPLHFHSCREWFDEWLTGKDGTTAPRTLEKYKQVLTDFLAHLRERANLPLSGISQRDVRAFRDVLVKAGLAASTVNLTVRKVLSAPFATAVRMGYIPVNPCAGVESLKDDTEAEKEAFTREQILKLYNAAVGDWQGVILAGYYTGLRLTDITELLWEAIDLEAGLIRVKTRKTGRPVTVPLYADLAEWLSRTPRGIAKAPVFPSLAGKSGGGKSGLSKQFKRIMSKAEIVGRITRARAKESSGRTHPLLEFPLLPPRRGD